MMMVVMPVMAAQKAHLDFRVASTLSEVKSAASILAATYELSHLEMYP
jgi:hypothetical protein